MVSESGCELNTQYPIVRARHGERSFFSTVRKSFTKPCYVLNHKEKSPEVSQRHTCLGPTSCPIKLEINFLYGT